MRAHYFDETGRMIVYDLLDIDALYSLAQMLTNAPIDLDYLILDDGVFNLKTFEIQ